ncbi:programmed cell death 1 ligand 1 isoform X2 [Elephas maximus indicus]|nr:programmed cell death 1 ligand 1 isoform X2 [Elephas maximus indicus]
MECTFPVGKQLNLTVLVVYWEKGDKKIIQFVDGEEDLKVQHSSYSQRAQLLKDQLALGKAVLQITDVKLRDAGVYRCLISYGGADYKRITLKVNAPYSKINQRVSVDPVTSEHELTCQAEGYPEAEVIWTNSDHQVLRGKTTITKGQEELFNVTSTLRVNTTAKEVFHCTFQRAGPEENSTAELVIPEPPSISLPSKRTHLILLGAVLLFLGVLMTVIFYLKRNGISFIAVVSTGGVWKYMRAVLSQCLLVDTIRNAKCPAVYRATPHSREPSYPKCQQASTGKHCFIALVVQWLSAWLLT